MMLERQMQVACAVTCMGACAHAPMQYCMACSMQNQLRVEPPSMIKMLINAAPAAVNHACRTHRS